MFEVDSVKIRRAIADSGLTAKAFAEKCGLNALTVARLIKGNTARTSIKIVGKLARTLGVDSESLILKERIGD